MVGFGGVLDLGIQSLAVVTTTISYARGENISECYNYSNKAYAKSSNSNSKRCRGEEH
jgi:hypothetical protein